MNQKERQQRYEDYINTVSATAAAIGRRKPYAVTYIKKRGKIVSVFPEQREEKDHDSADM